MEQARGGRHNCEHAVALVLAATGVAVPEPAAVALPWEEELSSLLEPPTEDKGQVFPDCDTPIAVELSLAGGAGPLKLRARLVQPGGNGFWVAGSLSWSRLDSLLYYGSHPRSHLRLLKELYCAYLAGTHRAGYQAPADERSIDLASFESRQFWGLLDEAALIGVPLVYPRKLGPVPRYRAAQLCLDVTRPSSPGPLLIRPVIMLDDEAADVAPVRFIGTTGHGLVYADADESANNPDPGEWRFELAKLACPVPPDLQRIALRGQPVEVPAGDAERFRREFYPRLRQVVNMISSDSSFAPRLTLLA
jgi:hypothetical protein